MSGSACSEERVRVLERPLSDSALETRNAGQFGKTVLSVDASKEVSQPVGQVTCRQLVKAACVADAPTWQHLFFLTRLSPTVFLNIEG